jgi:hypothetical protein
LHFWDQGAADEPERHLEVTVVMTSAQELSLTVGLLYGRKTGMSFELDVFSVCASKAKSFTSSGCKDHQLLVAAAIFPWMRTQLKRESTHSVNESKTIWMIF